MARLSTDPPHQKLEIADVIFFLVLEDRIKQLIGYVGVACATDFISTSFAALLRSFSHHPPTRLRTFVGIGSKLESTSN